MKRIAAAITALLMLTTVAHAQSFLLGLSTGLLLGSGSGGGRAALLPPSYPIGCLYVLEKTPDQYDSCRYPSMLHELRALEFDLPKCAEFNMGTSRFNCVKDEAHRYVEWEKQALLEMAKQQPKAP